MVYGLLIRVIRRLVEGPHAITDPDLHSGATVARFGRIMRRGGGVGMRSEPLGQAGLLQDFVGGVAGLDLRIDGEAAIA